MRTSEVDDLWAEAPSLNALGSQALPALAEELRASMAVIYRFNERGLEGLVAPGASGAISLYAERYARACPFQAFKRRHNPEVAVVSDMVDSSTLRRSEVVNEFYRPFDIERQLSVRISSVPHGRPASIGIVFCRSRKDPPFRQSEVEQLRRRRALLSSVVERARLFEELHAAKRGSDILASLLSSLENSPSLVFDHDGEVAFISRAASARLGEVLGEPAPGARLQSAVRRLLQPERQAEEVAPTEVALGPLRAVLLRGQLDRTGDPYAIVRLEENAPDTKLTPAESAVLEVLLEGKSNRGIAADLHISEGTVHSHLKSIYAKLGVHTRAEAIVAARRRSL